MSETLQANDDFTPIPQVLNIFDITEHCREHEYAECQQLVKKICTYVTHYGGWFQLTEFGNTEWWFALIMICSVLLGLTFFLFVYYTKELQAHPMKLIMLLALSESAFQYQFIGSFYICKSHANHLFSYTVFFNDDNYHMARSTLILLYSGIYSAIFFMLFSVSINSMLCLDLITHHSPCPRYLRNHYKVS